MSYWYGDEIEHEEGGEFHFGESAVAVSVVEVVLADLVVVEVVLVYAVVQGSKRTLVSNSGLRFESVGR